MNPELLQKYIAGNATEAEKQRVTEWIQENPENMREYMAQRKLHGHGIVAYGTCGGGE